ARESGKRACVGVMTPSVCESIRSILFEIFFQIRDQRVERRVEELERVEESQLPNLKSGKLFGIGRYHVNPIGCKRLFHMFYYKMRIVPPHVVSNHGYEKLIFTMVFDVVVDR